ncbi:retrovirus-related pol polyprotein from transposon TNT 1-94 [Tanacetum coccineum]
MADPIISISSEESVSSHAPRVILFGAILAIIPVIPKIPIVSADPIVAPKVGTVPVVSPTGALDLVDYSSSFDSDPSEDSLPPAPDLPLVSPFLCSGDSEADGESEPAEQRPVSSSHDTLAPLSEFPLAPASMVDSPVSTAFFSNNIVQDFQENSDDEADERTSEEYLRDLNLEFHERALLANSKRFIKRRNNFSSPKANESTQCYKCGKMGHFIKDCFSKSSEPLYNSPMSSSSSGSKGFQPKFVPKLIQSSQHAQTSHIEPKVQKDYKTVYKKMQAKLALLEAKEVSDEDDKETHVQVLMALVDDELSVGKCHARNGEWVDIIMKKVNSLLSMDENSDWQNYLKYINIDLKYVEEQRLNLLSKYNQVVYELNKCRDDRMC